MTNSELWEHFKKEVPHLGVLVAIGCTAAVAKQANKQIEPKIVEILSK